MVTHTHTHTSQEGYILSVLVAAYWILPAFTRELLQTFQCETIGGRRVLLSNSDVDCTTRSFTAIQALAAVYFVCFCIGCPVYMIVVLFRDRLYFGNNSSNFTYRVRFLLAGYRQSTWFFEAAVWLRKLILIFILYGTPTTQAVIGGLFFTFSLFANLYMLPLWKDPRIFQRLETAKDEVLLSTVFLGFWASTQTATALARQFWTIVIVLMHVVMWLCYAFAFVKFYREESALKGIVFSQRPLLEKEDLSERKKDDRRKRRMKSAEAAAAAAATTASDSTTTTTTTTTTGDGNGDGSGGATVPVGEDDDDDDDDDDLDEESDDGKQ